MSTTPETPIRTFETPTRAQEPSSSQANGHTTAEVPVDEVLPPATTHLDDLRAELTETPERKPITLPVPEREGWEAVFDLKLPQPLLAQWRKASTDKSGTIDELAVGQRLLANQNIGLRRRGEDLLDEGKPLTVRSPAFLNLIGEGRPMEAIRKFFVLDGHVLAAALEVYQAAGYGDDLTSSGSDPTPRR